MSTPTAKRSPEEIRASVEQHRKELADSIVGLKGEVSELTDWRKRIVQNRDNVMIGAAVVGFIVAGGIGAIGALVRRK